MTTFIKCIYIQGQPTHITMKIFGTCNQYVFSIQETFPTVKMHHTILH